VPLLLIVNWRRRLGSQEFKLLAMVAAALVATITKDDVGKRKEK
jgi:hypothetical protein